MLVFGFEFPGAEIDFVLVGDRGGVLSRGGFARFVGEVGVFGVGDRAFGGGFGAFEDFDVHRRGFDRDESCRSRPGSAAGDWRDL